MARAHGPPVLLSAYIAPVAILAAVWAMAAHLVDSLGEAETLNRELEARVAAKHAELEQNYGRMQALERSNAVAAERERIMRDMHDGMGGQLVSTLSLVESGGCTLATVGEALHDALDDLRMVIDSLDPFAADLGAALGAMRARLEPRLARHGIRFDWQVAELPAGADRTATRTLQILGPRRSRAVASMYPVRSTPLSVFMGRRAVRLQKVRRGLPGSWAITYIVPVGLVTMTTLRHEGLHRVRGRPRVRAARRVSMCAR